MKKSNERKMLKKARISYNVKLKADAEQMEKIAAICRENGWIKKEYARRTARATDRTAPANAVKQDGDAYDKAKMYYFSAVKTLRRNDLDGAEILYNNSDDMIQDIALALLEIDGADAESEKTYIYNVINQRLRSIRKQDKTAPITARESLVNRAAAAASKFDELTAKNRIIIMMLADGAGVRDIAAAVNLSPSAVARRIDSMYRDVINAPSIRYAAAAAERAEREKAYNYKIAAYKRGIARAAKIAAAAADKE